jgi:hypothetical protein
MNRPPPIANELKSTIANLTAAQNWCGALIRSTSQARRSDAPDATIAIATLPPGSLQRWSDQVVMVFPTQVAECESRCRAAPMSQ